MYAHSYIKTAAAIIGGYTGDEPLYSFLRQFFAKDKKYGSRDRKAISHLCYCYFRLGNALNGRPVEERIINALFLCSSKSDPLLQQLDEALNGKVSLPLNEKMNIPGEASLWQNIFPLQEHISDKIDKQKFITAHLTQPDLFLRIRPGYEETVKQIAEQHELPAAFPSAITLQLPNSIDAAKYFALNRQVVVQDRSSQQTGEFFEPFLSSFSNKKELSILDACAASGGKTIMLYDLLNGEGDFTVNDVRSSIMYNLEQRFTEAGIKKYHPFISDMAKEHPFPQNSFDIIIADVPCSGSGTWGRSPEHLAFFPENKLQEYAALQKDIIKNLPALLKKDGLLFYITCSIYEEENELNAEFLKECGMELLEERYFEGYLHKADSMYGAVFIKEPKKIIPIRH